jgi:hypothetical protein
MLRPKKHCYESISADPPDVSVLIWSFASQLFPAPDRKQLHTGIVTGRVLDPASMMPVPGAVVSWKSQDVAFNKAGHYEIRSPAGVREVAFSAHGFLP